ncbi:MAG: hypothetical protein CMH46_10200 [Muricauda sp.]|nr:MULTISPECIES: hypothetical protein [unclassified Allomuricauda]MAU15897.1 hypothetical protein [Allomuricauda sp.]|tara:strand:+ start:10452 stop:11060 length:609 start_codon:yes stop_codon:yes gene_type:complete
MSEFFKAELKDRFLEYALERNDYFQVQTLYDEFLRPNYSLEYAQKLVMEIKEYDPELIDIMRGNGMDVFMLASTSKTEDFLDQGGFMNLYVKEEEKWDVFLNQLSNAPKLTKEEKKLLKKNSSSSKREKTMLIGLISVVGISFLFTVVSIFKETLFEPDYVPADEFERKMDLLREQYILENEKLEKELMGIRRELDSLKKQF